jgi:phage terminase large subunit-like protein
MANDDAPDPARLIKLARQTLSSAERRRKYQRIDFLGTDFWYPTQLAFLAAGTAVHQRLIYGGNQSGKTICCAAEVAWHLTGDYPTWWKGKRYRKPIRAWMIGESIGVVRDTVQAQLCGGLGDNEFGQGTIPLESFPKKPIMVGGGQRAIDTIFVTHMTDGKIDGVSSAAFKSFDQRREKLQSESIDLVWIDERPSEEVYSELFARTSATDGHIIVSYTPIGEGAAGGLTYRFLSEPSADRAVFRITGEEAKHISDQRREELAAGYTDAERETRLEGIPQLGTGPIFPLELLPAIVRRFKPDGPDAEIRDYARWCVGIDFGFDHPFAAVMIAWHHDTGEVFVVDSFSMVKSSAQYHVSRIHSMTQGLRLPVAYPHDGSVHDKGSGLALIGQYKGFGLNPMSKWATNHGTNHYNVDPALEEMRELWYTHKLIIAPHNAELIEEFRHYHRDENFKIVKQRDDLISALRYAIMMRRQGKPRSECDGIGFGPSRFAQQTRDRSAEPTMAKGIDFDLHRV